MSWSEEINSQANQLQIAELQRLVERLNSENSRLNNENETLNHENQQLLNQLKVLNVLQSQLDKQSKLLATWEPIITANTTANDDLETELQDLQTTYADLQTAYIDLQNKLNS